MGRAWLWMPATGAAVGVAWWLPSVIGRYYTQMLAFAAIYVIVAQGLNLLVGFTGQTSLGHAGFYAVGAYTGALLTTKAGVGFWTAFPFAILVAAAVGVLVALPALKVEGPYLAMVTIAFGIIVESVLVEWSDVTGGTQGVLNIPRPTFAGTRLPLERQLVVIVVVAAITALVTRNLVRSPWGRAFVAVRDNAIAAQSVGLRVGTVKTVAFAISAACAGAGGHFFAALQGFISPEAFDFDTSIFFLTAVIFGGQATLLGPLVGAGVMTFLPELLQRFTDYRLIIYGAIIVGSLYVLPLGVVGTLSRRRLLGSIAGAAATVSTAAGHRSSSVRGAGPAVSFEDVHVAFGGIRALDGVTFEVVPRSIHALIGPNGAGKTVLLNVLCGYYRPTAGTIRLDGRFITGLPPDRIARLGIARTFQTTQLFGEMSVLDNVLTGFAGSIHGRLLDSALGSRRLRREEDERRSAALAMLEFVGSPGSPTALAKSLPFGHQRLVEIARALMMNPVILAMDEPAAGLNPHEVKVLNDLIVRIRARGIAVLLVEHHMDLVMAISDRITVLDHGEKLAEGTPAAIRADTHVVRAYLGEEPDDHG
jgi:ABC-type branched-subunit amino acid transport system ATPase component/ABC-type branched-subunit amino acid transport system permease subunit